MLAINATGLSAPSNTASATTLDRPANAPTALRASKITSTSVQLDWTDNSNNETGFRVQRSSDGVTFTTLTTVQANTRTYTDRTLSPGTTYYYRIRATDSAGDSVPSNVVTVPTLPAAPPAPSTLTLAVVSTARDRSHLAGQQQRGGVLQDPALDRRRVHDGDYHPGGAEHHHLRRHVAPARYQYYYRIVATNTGGDSRPSNTASATTLPAAPAAPTGLTVTFDPKNASALLLKWTDRSSNELGFKVMRSADNGVTFSLLATVAPGVTAYSDTGLGTDTTYVYEVVATNAGGDSAPSNQVTAVTLPAAPTSLAATALTSTRVRLFWTNNSTTLTGFKIQRKTGAGPYVTIATVAPDVDTYEDAAAAGGTTYTYQVLATNQTGSSLPSNPATVTTLPNPPAAPTGLTAVALDQHNVQLTWRDNSTTETGFRILRSSDNGASYNEINDVAANVKTYTDTGLDANSRYLYQVVATNTGGDFAASNTATVTTKPDLPAAPSNVGITAPSPTSLQITWQDNSGGTASFKVERKTGSGGYTLVATVGPGLTGYTDNGLKQNTTYAYRVLATNAGGDFTPSDPVIAVTPPAAPSGLTAAASGNGQVTLHWSPNLGGTDGYKIERSVSGGGFQEIPVTIGGTATSFTDTGLLGGTAFSYRIRAFNGGGFSGYSNVASVTLQPSLQSVSLELELGAGRPHGYRYRDAGRPCPPRRGGHRTRAAATRR